MIDDIEAALLLLRRIKHILFKARTVRPGNETLRYLTAIVQAENAIDAFISEHVEPEHEPA